MESIHTTELMLVVLIKVLRNSTHSRGIEYTATAVGSLMPPAWDWVHHHCVVCCINREYIHKHPGTPSDNVVVFQES